MLEGVRNNGRNGIFSDPQYRLLLDQLNFCQQQLAEISSRRDQRNNRISRWNVSLRDAPKFNGNVHRYPTPEFLRDFEDFIYRLEDRLYVDDNDKRRLFLCCLEGDADQWARVFATKHQSFESICAAFRRRFWGPDIQRRFIQEFHFGTYRQRGMHSKMAPYYLGFLRRMQALKPDLREDHFNNVISHHYPLHFQRLLQNQPSTEDVYLFLLEEDQIYNSVAKTHRNRCQQSHRDHHVDEFTQTRTDQVNSEAEDQTIVEDGDTTNTTASMVVHSRSRRGERCNGSLYIRDYEKEIYDDEQREVRNDMQINEVLAPGEEILVDKGRLVSYEKSYG